ncbi:hypothetical protein BACSTE_00763 [Bacteroides stercoris ATCC 43183]|uniref:Uncharacterized protein n=1 Tax=Bacteroides stercoris ATCC 43183 TaxID=449673 RepID=B0NMS4_BACSE|nr:hypothetical protein BACSTE_00763 [Bacteroides stercoris ATCC 43183]
MGHLPTRCSSSVIHNDLVFIVYGAILRRYYKVIGYSTVEQPPKKDRKRQNEIKKAGSNLRPFLKEQASEPHVCLCSFQTPSPYMEK